MADAGRVLIRSIAVRPAGRGEVRRWPFTVPAIAQVAREGMQLTSSFTVLLGANGSGKSTLLEAIAEAYGLDRRGGHGDRRHAITQAATPLGSALELTTDPASASTVRRARGFFLRAETAHDVLDFMASHEVPGYGPRPEVVSHGESYLGAIEGRIAGTGLYLLDEAEGPLSFGNTLRLLDRLRAVTAAGGAHVVYATHSPLVAAVPEAQIFELDAEGLHERAFADLDMVAQWQAFLRRPDLFFED
mgnify:CR=1 FL=1